MALRRINSSRFDHGKDQAQKSARTNLTFVLQNHKHLLKARKGDKLLADALDMAKQKEDLTPNQISYINDVIYDKTAAQITIALAKKKNVNVELSEVDTGPRKHDKKKTLRY